MKGKFRKTKVYSRMFVRQENKQKVISHDGYSDNEYYYYKTIEKTFQIYQKEKTIWFAIDPMTGLGICNAESRKECYEFAHSLRISEALEEKRKTENYTKLCSEWYNMMVECGAYMENPIK